MRSPSNPEATPLFGEYFALLGDNESPNTYHRWALLTALGALIERRVYYQLGNTQIHGRLYVILSAPAGDRKSSAIISAKKLLRRAGFEKFAADQTSKEAFWEDLGKGYYDDPRSNDLKSSEKEEPTLDQIDFCSMGRTVFICADELADFLGRSDEQFSTNLGKLWDSDLDEFRARFRSYKTYIEAPNVSMLGGITPQRLTRIFSVDAIGGGLFSRIIFIAARDRKPKFFKPTRPDKAQYAKIVSHLEEVRDFYGEISSTPEAEALLKAIYESDELWEIPDQRFSHFASRRYEQLLRICVILCAMRLQSHLTPEVVREANTILVSAELMMPSALGQFGAARDAPVTQAIVEMLDTHNGMTAQQVFQSISTDVNGGFEEVKKLLADLTQSGKVIKRSQGRGAAHYVRAHLEVREKWNEDFVNWSVLTPDEIPVELTKKETKT